METVWFGRFKSFSIRIALLAALAAGGVMAYFLTKFGDSLADWWMAVISRHV